MPVVSRFTPDPERKTPALPIDLRFLSSIGVTEWKKAALKTCCRKPLERRKPWQAPTVSTFASLLLDRKLMTQSETRRAGEQYKSHPPTSAKQFAKGSRLTE